MADALRQQLDGWAKKIQGLGKGYLADAIENYMGHIWGELRGMGRDVQPLDKTRRKREPRRWTRAQASGASVRSVGSGSFLKQRSFPTQTEGIEAGLVPATYNPVDLQLIKLHDMQKFYYGTTLAEHMKASGIAKWVPGADYRDAQMRGYVRWMIRSSSRHLRGKQNPAGFGSLEPGAYFAPEPAARVFNNYMSKGWHGQSAIYDAVRRGNNALNTLQLGMSGFHATFVTADTAISKLALGIQQLSRGQSVEGPTNVIFGSAAAPAAVVRTVMRGCELRRAWLAPEDATPQMRQIVDALKAGGGRISMPRFYQTSASGRFSTG